MMLHANTHFWSKSRVALLRCFEVKKEKAEKRKAEQQAKAQAIVQQMRC